MIDDTANRLARRVAVHQSIDRSVDARQEMGGDGTAEALSEALDHLALVALHDDERHDTVEDSWRAVAAIAQGQLEQAMEERAT